MTSTEFRRVLFAPLTAFASMFTNHAPVHSSQGYTIYRVSQEERHP